jgi:hypothetical protein
MKKLYTLLALVITLITNAQAPQGFNYQATVRNSAGDLIVNQNVYFKFNLMLNSASSVPVFSETHYTPTDDLGQVNIVIGQGTATVGNFSTINWGNGNYYLGIELNTGAGYVAMGTTQLLSVPYALYANSSGNAQTPTPNLASVLAVNNGANNLQIKNLAEPTDSEDAATKNYVDNQIATVQISSQGKTSIYLTGNITNAQAAEKIAAELGPNTDNIYILNTTQLTTLDLTGLNISSTIRIVDNQNLTNINLSSLTNNFIALTISNNPLLTSINLNGLNYFRELNFANNALTSNTINSLLNKFLTVLPASEKYIGLHGQTPPAPPTGQGLIDRLTLVNTGNYVYTDD